MKERPHQLGLGLEFESIRPIENASFSASRQYIRDYQNGNINMEAWINIASVHTRFKNKILRFPKLLGQAWEAQDQAEPDDTRTQYIEAIKNEPEKSELLMRRFLDIHIRESVNLALVEDLFWIRTPDYYPPDYISSELDIIYGEITPVLILEDEFDSGDVEHPHLYIYHHEEIIQKILSGQIGLDPSFPPTEENLEDN